MSKKKMFALGISFVLIFTVGWFMGDASAINRVNRNINKNISLSEAPAQTTVTPAKTPEIKQIDFGQVADLGQFEFKVLGAENVKEAKTTTKSISTTTNTYEIVKLEVVNKHDAPAQLNDFKFKLTDLDKKTTYDLNSDVSISLNTSLRIYDKKPAIYIFDDMNPNLKNEFTAVFEVPSESNYVLVIAYKNDAITLKVK